MISYQSLLLSTIVHYMLLQYFKQMARCETYNIAQVVKGSKLETKKDKIEKSDDNDTKAVSIQDIIKDLR